MPSWSPTACSCPSWFDSVVGIVSSTDEAASFRRRLVFGADASSAAASFRAEARGDESMVREAARFDVAVISPVTSLVSDRRVVADPALRRVATTPECVEAAVGASVRDDARRVVDARLVGAVLLRDDALPVVRPVVLAAVEALRLVPVPLRAAVARPLVAVARVPAGRPRLAGAVRPRGVVAFAAEPARPRVVVDAVLVAPRAAVALPRVVPAVERVAAPRVDRDVVALAAGFDAARVPAGVARAVLVAAVRDAAPRVDFASRQHRA